MNDSTLFMSKKKSRGDSFAIPYQSIYSIRQGRPVGKGILIGGATGLFTGLLIGAVMDAGQKTATTVFSLGMVEPEDTDYAQSGAIIGLLVGGATGSVIDQASQKTPIGVNHSKQTFNEIQPALQKYAVVK
jgi:ethanolamine transporter EutH